MVKQNKLTPDQAIQLAMKEQGYVVIGLPASEHMRVWAGCSVDQFCGFPIKGSLVVRRRATREDWDRQCALFNRPDPNQHSDGERYFKCDWEDES